MAEAGEIGKATAEALHPKLEADQERRMDRESDADFDARVLDTLDAHLKPEVEAFNQNATEADQITAKKSSGKLEIYKANLPVFALWFHERRMIVLPPDSTTPVCDIPVTAEGGVLKYGGLAESGMMAGLLRAAAAGAFRMG